MNFEEFQEFRKILCICPECGKIVRLSDFHLKVKGKVAKTWLDEYNKEQLAMETKEERFGEIEGKLREVAREKGRKEAERAINKAISPELKALKLDPYDIKPILNPVDFVVFKGMDKKDAVSDIILLSKAIKNKELNILRWQVKKTIEKKKYDWQVARIDEKGNIGFE